ncbi:MFS transporter [Microvirga pakistanensis]|uniref:MFS transporter n=1 Tax=Microvirga pakistanensis TaxID=1682650 RepID=UPI00195E9EF4|nr:MFS transporter [Microvirga pakistanensis]
MKTETITREVAEPTSGAIVDPEKQSVMKVDIPRTRWRRAPASLTPQRRVFVLFFMFASCSGTFFARVPDLQLALGAGEGAFGGALVGTSVGTLVALTFAGPIVERVGHRRTLLLCLPLLSMFYAAATLAPTPLMLLLTLVPAGLALGVIEIVVNLETGRIEHATGRRIMSRAHAFWSLGFFVSSLAGAALAQLGLTRGWHLGLAAVLVSAATWLVLRSFQAAPERACANVQPLPAFVRPSGPILILVCIVLPAMVLEGAGFNWSGIYMREQFAASPFLSGLAVAIGAGAQALVRFVADGFVGRNNPVMVARILLAVAGLGTALVVAAGHEWIALVGFGLIGVGISAVYPIAMSAAALRTDRPAAVNVAALAQISFVTFLVAPAALGFVAEHWGIRWSFAVALPFILVSMAAARVLASKHS